MLAFYKELDLGTEGEDEWDNSRLGNLVFLSARPHVYKDVSENVTYQKFRWLQETRGLHTSPSLLAGTYVRANIYKHVPRCEKYVYAGVNWLEPINYLYGCTCVVYQLWHTMIVVEIVLEQS